MGERKVDRSLWIFYIGNFNFLVETRVSNFPTKRSSLSWTRSVLERSFIIGRIVDEIGLQVATSSSVAGDS